VEAIRKQQAEYRSGNFEYECVVCVAKADQLSEHDALRMLKRARTQKHVDRSDRFSYARRHVQNMFAFATEIKLGKKQTIAQTKISLKQLADFFEPMMKILQLKLMDEELGLAACVKYKAWESAHPDADDEEKGFQIDIELEVAMTKWRAFESKGSEQVAYCRAADYSDIWFEKGGTNGTRFSKYFVCRSGGSGEKCNTLTPNKDWKMMHADPLAEKQRWYCLTCGCRYKTTFGVVCELKLANAPKPVYCFAEFPEQAMLDAKFSMVEEGFANRGIQPAQELFDAIPKLKPLNDSQILVANLPGRFKFVGVKIEDLPVLEWFQLFNLCGVPLPVKPKKNRKRGSK
jgi:hypothetical protein